MIVHLNGELLPVGSARVSVLDRGFLFGDGLYEGLRAFDGRIVAMDLHVKRLRDGLHEAHIPWDAPAMAPLTEALLEANHLKDAFVYWQVTRGAPSAGQPVRTRVPPEEMRPTVFGYATATPGLASYGVVPTKSCSLVEDIRWLKGRVKSISLIGNVMLALEAHRNGADDAIIVRDGMVAEGSSSNLFAAVPREGGGVEIVTPSLESAPILAGVTRAILLRELPEIVERPLSVDELERATEVMLVGTLTMVTSILSIDDRRVGSGAPGPVAHKLLEALVGAIRSEHR